MGGKHHGVLFPQSPDQVADLDNLLGVETDGRLVEEQHARMMNECPHDEQAALHAAREAAHAVVFHIFELDIVQQLMDARFALAASHVVQTRVELHVLPDREVLVEIDMLRHDADQALDVLCMGAGVLPVIADRAGRRLHQECQHPDRRRLARAIRPEQAERLALADRERELVDGRLVRVLPARILVRVLFREVL